MSRNIQGKTEDGINLSTIVKAASEMPMVRVREGTKHPIILQADGVQPCPVSTSSDAKRMLSSWLKQVTGYSTDRIYLALKAGTWYYR